ncbi:Succinate dehydrogenase [ubiquinone] cytochrome b small subunit, mitochondrial [Amphibalanus amphitrite]|uniref:Succinate dehydrogenase [ubiquinone] cytochrome b small subunit n=2 Tax=Amphibalanus amphitrite TaxID=1232801 RepID=A0A6A4WWW3_AMPAM|nr:succinate dehydrogenase [ubiquinone] cytochrome b small subunit, mitochondrial-like isoform X1 [Amphibalanus amphitrite]XP_043191317.1 succinate dehydrogenase [ubiquinone] cytochrome b small subunit, mitochondrial-like isoform X1 [Amphibalanus amphitrite]XP_043191318.1 succinate dehydrogenase [ubiquinone] cytochrome b small subunit, mitochondrial-like isoform X1 [Amphibalanus amphitrite]XP_043191319.1 succinate dehydrogenase [ubiquinone] cytochrome b small subunit, mitochondrial-like isoform 
MALLCGFRRLPCLQRSVVQVTAPWLSARAAAPLSVSRPALSSQLAEDHVKHWNAERLLTVGLLGVLPVAFTFPSPALDYAVALSVAVHSHWGMEAIFADYARPKRVGVFLSKAAIGANYFMSAFLLGALFYFNYTDVGVVEAVKMLWRA